MALTTRCPQCGTTFKVVPDQLRVRNGLVRCGACSTVFDGRACLLPGADAKALPPVAQPAPPAPAAAAAAAAPVLSRPSAEPRQVPPWEDEPEPPRPAPVMPPAPVAPRHAPTMVPEPLDPVAPRQSPVMPPAPLASRDAPIAPPAYAAPRPAPIMPPAPVPPSPQARAEPVIAPAAPAAAASAAAAPAVLRGRDAIRRHVEPEDTLPEDESDDDRDFDGDSDDDVHDHRHDRVPAHRPDPHVATPRGNEPVFTWSDRDDADQDDPHHDVYARNDGDHDAYSRGDRPHNVRQDEVRHHDIRDHDGYRADESEPGFIDDLEPVLGEARTRYSSATDVGRAPPEFLDQDRSERRGLMRKLWGYACLLGLIALGLQLLFVYRTDIANSVPALRPILETACKPLGCTVGYARRLERIAISSSSLQPPTGAAAIDDGRSRLVLNLVLRNRYDKPQHWPALVLDLTDLSDTVVVRRVLRPEDYLTPEQLRGPFAPAGELKISVPIEVTGVQVNGYQLDKFFP